MKSGWRVRCGVTLTAFCCLIGGCGDSGETSEATRSEKPLPDRYSGASIPVIDRPSSLQTRTFLLMRTLPEGLPVGVEEILRQPTHGMNWDLAQRLPTTARGRFWAVPGRGVICIFAQQDPEMISSNCTKTPHAVAHGLAAILVREISPPTSSSPSSFQRLMVGIAPSGAHTIRVYTDGVMHSAEVAEGAFTLRDRVANPPQKMVPLG